MTPAVPPGEPMLAPAAPESSWPFARINFGVLVGDVTCFLIGTAFLDSSTALPAIVERLGGGQAFVGFLLAMRQAAYYLPPLFVAHSLQGRTRYKPFLIRVCIAGRIWLFVAAFCIWRFGMVSPGLALGVLAAAYTLSWAGDGAGGVPWTAIIGRTIPPRRRGALFATTQVLSAVGRMAAGVAVLCLLGGAAGFPANAALLTLLCSLALLASWLFLLALREPDSPAPSGTIPDDAGRQGFGHYLREIPGRLRARPEFARLALSQILSTAGPASAPFIVIWAERHTDAAPLIAHLPPVLRHFLSLLQSGGLPGLCLIAQTLGLVVLAPLWGWLTDRHGPKTALRGVYAIALLTPACALLAPHSHGPIFALLLFLLAYFCLGAVQDVWVTYTNFLLEIVPESEQTSYIALMSTASAPACLLPIVAGQIAEHAGPPAAFALSLALLLAGLWSVAHLPETRKPAVEGQNRRKAGKRDKIA